MERAFEAAPIKRQFTLRQLLALMFGLAVVSAVIGYSLPLGILLGLGWTCIAVVRYRWLTLAETLVSLAILGVVVALLLPAIRTTYPSGRRTQCRNNLKQIALALHNYHDTHGVFPPAYTVDSNGQPLLSWRVLILPYLEDQALYEQFHLDEPWDSPHNLPLSQTMPQIFACHADPSSRASGTTKYVAVVHDETLWPGERSLNLGDIEDGSANTLLVVEWTEGKVVWTAPSDLTFPLVNDSWRVPPVKESQTHHHGAGVNVALADGHVRFVYPHKLPMPTLRALLTPAGNEKLPKNWEEAQR